MNVQLPQPVTAPFSNAQRAMIVNLVRRAARAEIMPRFRKLDTGQIGTKSGPMDIVTEADTAAEAMIARALQSAFPSAVIVGEESVETVPDYRERLANAELGFLIDPVDGTWNFAHGLPLFGTMIAATRFGRPIFGMIFDPVGRDFIWADIETPATWVPRSGHPRRIRSRRDRPLSDIIGFGEPAFMRPDHRRAATQACLELGQVTSLRCSAHHYRLLAEGAVDFNLGVKLHPWDHAAGVLLCQRAGGHAAMLDGTPYSTSIDTGYLLSAGDRATWDRLAEHFSALVTKTA